MSDLGTSAMSQSTASWRFSPRVTWLGILAIAGITCIAYWPAMHGDFVWDDEWLLLNNKVIHAPDGLYRIWFTTEPNYYWPVTNSVFWTEWRLFGTNTVGYHIVNVLLHISAALLIWLLLRRLEIPGGFLAALLWAVHPVSVEGVAWISQLKTVLSTVFFLLSILAFIQADSLTPDDQRAHRFGMGRWYWLSLLAFLLGMLSKASIAPLPLMLLLIVWWRHDTITRWDLVRVVPFVLVAAALVPVNMWFETHGSGEAFRHAGFLERLAGAATVPWFYLGKALVPLDLMFIYPLWSIDTSDVRWWLPLLASMAVTAVLIWQRNTRLGRPLLFAWGFFWLGLIPVLGFTDVSLMRFTLVSDHYQYISLIAVMAVVAAGWTMWLRSMWNTAETGTSRPRWSGYVAAYAAWVVAAAAVGALVVLTSRESATYRDAYTLLTATVERNPECWIAISGIGIKLSDAHRTEEAISHFERALRYQPDYAAAHDHWGLALLESGRAAEAIPHFEQAVRLDPKSAGSYNNLGAALVQLDRMPEAVVQFQKAVDCDPSLEAPHCNLASALYRVGHPERAVAEFQAAIRINPNRADSLCDLGAALLNSGRPQEAIEPLERALRIDPNHALAHMNLGNVMMQLDRPQEAITQFELCLQLDSDAAVIWSNLAKANARVQRKDEAILAGQRAASLARSQGRMNLASDIETFLNENYGSSPATPSLPPESAPPPGPALPPGP